MTTGSVLSSQPRQQRSGQVDGDKALTNCEPWYPVWFPNGLIRARLRRHVQDGCLRYFGHRNERCGRGANQIFACRMSSFGLDKCLGFKNVRASAERSRTCCFCHFGKQTLTFWIVFLERCKSAPLGNIRFLGSTRRLHSWLLHYRHLKAWAKGRVRSSTPSSVPTLKMREISCFFGPEDEKLKVGFSIVPGRRFKMRGRSSISEVECSRIQDGELFVHPWSRRLKMGKDPTSFFSEDRSQDSCQEPSQPGQNVEWLQSEGGGNLRALMFVVRTMK